MNEELRTFAEWIRDVDPTTTTWARAKQWASGVLAAAEGRCGVLLGRGPAACMRLRGHEGYHEWVEAQLTTSPQTAAGRKLLEHEEWGACQDHILADILAIEAEAVADLATAVKRLDNVFVPESTPWAAFENCRKQTLRLIRGEAGTE